MDFENAETLTEVDDTFVTLSRCNKSFIEKVQFWAKKTFRRLTLATGDLFFVYFSKIILPKSL